MFIQCIHVTLSLPDFSIPMIFDCLHTLGIRFSVMHTLSIECSHL